MDRLSLSRGVGVVKGSVAGPQSRKTRSSPDGGVEGRWFGPSTGVVNLPIWTLTWVCCGSWAPEIRYTNGERSRALGAYSGGVGQGELSLSRFWGPLYFLR